MLYAASTSLPGLLQSLFGYDALNAGLVMSPAGFFAVVAMPIVGFVLGLTGFPTHVLGINAMGQIVGYSGLSGFLYIPNASGGIYTRVDAPGSAATVAYGINDADQIVGAPSPPSTTPWLPMVHRHLASTIWARS
jgi:hypothetical protein